MGDTKKSFNFDVLKSLNRNNCMNYVERRLPIIKWLPHYSLREKLLSDIISGITVGLMIVPQSLAIVRIIGTNPIYGLYSSLIGVIVYIFLGTSKDMSLGPTVLVAIASVKGNVYASPIYASIQAFMSGLFLLLMGIFNLGFLMNFIAASVISGFVSAAAITIGVSQLPTFLGIFVANASAKSPIIVLIEVFKQIHNAHIWDSILSVFFLIFLISLQQILQRIINPRMKNLDTLTKKNATIIKIFWFVCVARIALLTVVAILFCYIIKSSVNGSTMSIIGQLDSGLPQLWNPFQSANVSINTNSNSVNYEIKNVGDILSDISVSIILTAIISMMEHLSVAKSFSRRFQYVADYSQELFASGMANIMTSFFRGFPIGSSLPRCAVNAAAGVKSPISGIFVCGVVILTLTVLTPVFSYVPKSLLAAIIISAVIPMFDYDSLIMLWKIRKLELINWIVTFGAGLYSLEIGIGFGAAFSVGFILFREMRPRIKSRHEKNYSFDNFTKGDATCTTITFNGGLHYPGAEYLSERVRKIQHENNPTIMVFECQALFEIDVTVALELKQIILENELKNIKTKLINVKKTSAVFDIFQNLNLTKYIDDSKLEESNKDLTVEKIQYKDVSMEKIQYKDDMDEMIIPEIKTDKTHTLCFDTIADGVVAVDGHNMVKNNSISADE